MTTEQRQELFDYMQDQYNILLLESDIDDIECIVKGKEQYIKEANEAIQKPQP